MKATARCAADLTTMLLPNNWALFNLTTHENEGQEDFDRARVDAVIGNLEQLDAALSPP